MGTGQLYEAHLLIAKRWTTPFVLCAVLSPFILSACSETTHGMSVAGLADAIKPSFERPQRYSAKDKECMERAMFFESHRSSREGMIAVGTVVMNRKRSGQYPDTICGVVGQKKQFAPGVLTRKMNSKAMPDVEEAADAVLKGERHPKLKSAMHFHTAGLKFKYKNMHYVTVAGGNSFYEKRGRNWQPLPDERSQPPAVMVASIAADPVATVAPEPVAASAAQPTAVALIAPPSSTDQAVAFAEPSSARFGGTADAFPVAPVAPVYAEVGSDQSMMSLQASQQDADSIGALLLRQERPFTDQ